MEEERLAGHIFTVSQLTREIKILLEETYPFIWVSGEISNYSLPSSGHSYFTLKDSQSTIQSVIFKNQKSKLRFELENGLTVYGLARLSVYEPRGTYQLIFEHLEPEGSGILQLSFEQLKKKLSDKGYFDQIHKQPIPLIPMSICIITSGTGAALKDMLNISKRRFSNCCLEIIPVKVQGPGSEKEVVDAIHLANDRQSAQIIILARGGGSLEDLSAFNSESVADAIFFSKIPIITGIGHETDFTIADFVSDLRAPTPSAAIEIALPDKQILIQNVIGLKQKLHTLMINQIKQIQRISSSLCSRIKNPEMNVYHHRLRLADMESRLNSLIKITVLYQKEKNMRLGDTLSHLFNSILEKNKSILSELDKRLEALSPFSVLRRGYSITRFAHNKQIIIDSADIQPKDILEIILYQGRLIASVEDVDD